MRCVSGRQAGQTLAYGIVGLIVATCSPGALAQSRGGSTGGTGSFGSGSSTGGSSIGGGSSLGGGGSTGAGSFSGSSSGSSSSFLSASSGGSSSFGSGGAGIIGTTSSMSALGSSSSQGGAFGGQSRTGATGTGGVSSSNPFASYYANPLAAGLGLSGVTSRTTFGNPLYANVNPTSTSGSGGTGLSGSRGLGTPGTGGGGGFPGLGSAGGYGSGAYGAGTTGVRIAPKYSAAVSFSSSPAASGGLQVNLQRILSQSGALQASRDIQVAVDGPTVVLRGWAADDHDRRLAEGMVRLTPGVRDVRNELQVGTAAAPQPPGAAGPASRP